MKLAEKINPVTSLQPPYNLINRKIEKEILPYCLEKGIGTIVYSPMASGLLTGAFTKDRVKNLPDDDWRKTGEWFTEPNLTRNLKLADKVIEIAKRHGRNPGEIAVAWTLSHPAVTGAIVGVRNVKQVDEVLKAGEVGLSDKEKNELESF